MTSEAEKIRLDKWLWAARFFKTRSLAVEAINGGKVHLNGRRVKASQRVAVGDSLIIRRGHFEHEITVDKLSRQRRPATEASLLYQESDASKTKRETLAMQLREAREYQGPAVQGRPSKRERRQIIRFTRKNQ
ncbi:RNA-binding S4 domain-containing protein [Nitrosococcus oceani]|uniref:Heat shock protein 15 n=2 Tax=Nitrosococcus oceani TaxID=1229 RepID=Q3JCR3_NITOC|nr:S4 domain-containing protein [Nitrosococcus oceani]KFI20206.1 tRNA synthetase RNA-binding protein [Nitrosococcus oceani C-27]ABA57383.1 heat shock protein Hsp15 [Nitrosococcus oceani ATCC 19707]EDZ67775.1 S4 domain protein [Nitrosococcus oceani AFC27]KFI23459.1 tRNA synthetase RNA-binding protein [Nitrosococcus oceani]GEM21742.1 RNA-binding protein [Nitrosococcus oceani]